jgi:hypothetical protein
MKHMRLVTFLIIALCVFCLPVMAEQVWVYEGSSGDNGDGLLRIEITERKYGSDLRYLVNGSYRGAQYSHCTISGTYFPAGQRLRAKCVNPQGRTIGDITGRLVIEGGEYFELNTSMGDIVVNRIGRGPALPTGGLTGAFKIVQTADDGAKYTGQLEIKQAGSQLSGRAVWDNHMSGTIDGTVQGKTVRFTITYSGGLVGTYNAELFDNAMEGSASSNKGGGTVKWYAKRVYTGG